MKRCSWCNLNNPLYVEYHDVKWETLILNDEYLFEMLMLESFQAWLSWECVLNKRNDFNIAYAYFNINKIIKYDDIKINELLSNSKIKRIFIMIGMQIIIIIKFILRIRERHLII